MIKTIVTGCCGRMGSTVIKCLAEETEMVLIGAIESAGHPNIGKNVNEIMGLDKFKILIDDNLEEVIDKSDVVIEFINPDTTLKNLEIVKHYNKKMVIGTTGFKDEDKEIIRNHAKDIAIVLSPNMSVGVNLLFKLVKDVALILGDSYNIEIIESHHIFKKDAPSGTAIKIAEILAKAKNKNLEDIGVYGRKGLVGQRSREEIGIHAVRAGDIVGDHTVMFGGLGERLEIIHRAHSRDNFALGAIRASKFIVNKENGLYDMQDVLGLK
ncbi:MAG: 4-hydroxy-tetrahydrodipicolinate reductase [Candidatus Firestonebacteria bacterium]|nr:4-hydroxy-tetrahydrodipicolinate reductase [Candidatus Firestonebacteria bacterium]